jgi:UDP-N-acetylmuramoyl-tripeptide--D-alanyl-D-alanine ligase
MFFPLCGDRYNGEDYISEAKELGAITVSAKDPDADLLVKDSSIALLSLAEEYLKLINPKYKIAITGSVGKTTTKNFAAAILRQKFKTHSTEGNKNNCIGVPFTVLSGPKDTDVIIIEAGMNQRGELARISKCIKPDIIAITNIGTSHIGNLGSRNAIALAKKELTTHMSPKGKVLIPYGEALLADTVNSITVCTDNSCADISFLRCGSPQDNTFDLRYFNESITNIKFDLLGSHNPSCLSFALGISKALRLSDEEILMGIKQISTKDVRILEIKAERLTILDDSYNSSPESIRAALITLREHKSCKKSICIGDILELGSHSEKLHYDVGKMCAGYNLKNLYLVGKYSKYVKSGAIDAGFHPEKIHINENSSNLALTAYQIKEYSEDGEVLLIKASHQLNLKSIIEMLL